mgnify:FL=1
MILIPARTQALQVKKEFEQFGCELGLKSICICEEEDSNVQKIAIQKGIELVIATPGELFDLLKTECISLNRVSYAVIDEAHKILDHDLLYKTTRITQEKASI